MAYLQEMTDVGIIGASGFTGAELLRLCAAHPDLHVRVATGDSQAGTSVADLYPSLAAHYGDLAYAPTDPAAVDGCDVVFLGLPHGASQALVPELRGSVGHIIDLGADYRLRDASLYPAWYGEAHANPELLAEAAYGLPELFREPLHGATLVAAPGCYPTAASLALAPFVRAGLVDPAGMVVDAASGVSGAGRGPKANTTFCAVDEDYTAYGLVGHRHTPEIEQVVAAAADGEHLVTLQRAQPIRIVELGEPFAAAHVTTVSHSRGPTDRPSDLALHPDGRRFALATETGRIAICDLHTGAATSWVVPESGPREPWVGWPLAFSPDGATLFLRAQTGRIRRYELGSLKTRSE